LGCAPGRPHCVTASQLNRPGKVYIDLLYSLGMSTLTGRTRTVSVTEAAARGVAGLVKDAEAGEDLVVARHGTAVAAVISVDHFARITEVEEDLRDAALVLARSATGSGARTSLDEALAMFGLERAELEAELASDLAAGRG